MSHAATARHAALWSIGGQYAAFALQFVVSVIISRFFLSPSEMGLYSIGLSAAMMVSIFQDFGLSRFISGSREMSDETIRTCFSVALVIGIGVALIIAALSWPVAYFYDDRRLIGLLLAISGSYLLVPFGIIPNAILLRRMDFRSIFIVNIGAAIANAAVALSLAASGYSALSLAFALVAQQGVRVIVGMWRSGVRFRLPITFRGARPIVRFGSGTTALYISGSIGVRAPELIIGRVLSLAAVGFYGRATSLAAQMQMLVGGAVDSVFYTSFARLRDEGVPLASPYERVVAVYSGVTWPAMAFLAAAAQPIVLMLYGARWAAVAPLLTLISLSQIFISAVPMHIELPILFNRMRTLLVLNVVDTVVSVAFLIFGAWYGINGAALSRVAYGLVWFGIYIGLIHALTQFDWRVMIGNYGRSLLSAMATAAPILCCYKWMAAPDRMTFGQLLMSAILGCCAWLVVVFATRHPVTREIMAMFDVVKAFGRGRTEKRTSV